MNKQPFYHRVTILFTDTTGVNRSDDIEAAVNKLKDVVKGSVVVEEYEEPDPGDPQDLT